MKQFSLIIFHQDDRTAESVDMYPVEKEAINELHAWARKKIEEDEYFRSRLENVYFDGTMFEGDLDDTEALLAALRETTDSVSFETTGGDYIDCSIWQHECNFVAVHGAQYDNQNGDLRSFVKICATVGEAIQFVIDDFKRLAEAYKEQSDGITFPTAKMLLQTKCAESPNTWPVWTKWTISTEP
jgi:hypothetical protein